MSKTPLICPLLVGLLGACGQAPAKCDEAACKSICEKSGAQAAPAAKAPAAKAGASGLSAFEQGLVDPILEDVRAGIRPFADNSVGLCKGAGKDCEEFLGLEAELTEGEYMLRAELRVPKSGDNGTWKVKLETECETVTKTKSGESKSSRSSSKEYTVRYVGEDHGYRLSPLYKITSPHKGGTRNCAWKLVMMHPDGDKTVEGKWMVPAAE